MINPFTPGLTVNLTGGAASARVALPQPLLSGQVMVTNDAGGATAFIAFGDVTVVAALPAGGTPANGTPVLPGAAYIFTINSDVTHMAAITAGAAATLYATIGQGD